MQQWTMLCSRVSTRFKMHRSVTFSEIFSSTFSDDLNRYDESCDKNVKTKFIAKIGIGLVEFLLSSIFLCYGIIFSDCVNHQYYTIENGLWTTILYTSSWSIASPWSRHIYEYFEINKYSVFRCIIFAATILLFIGLIIPGQVLSYGIFGGIFSNLITTQLKFIATEKFDMDLKVFEGNVQVARALTLLIMPHFVLLLVSYYTEYQVKYIFAAFLLNILPAALIIRPTGVQKEYSEISRYQTLPAFSNQMREMMEFSNSVISTDHNKSESSSSADEEEEKEVNSSGSEIDLPYINVNSVHEELLQPVYLTPLTVQTYYQKAGVSILPEIPEELESETDDNVKDAISARRLSRISTKLEEINQRSKRKIEKLEETENLESFSNEDDNLQTFEKERKDSIKEILNINDLISNRLLEVEEKIENIEYIPNYSKNNTAFLRDLRVINKNYCCGCSPYRKFIWKRRFRSTMDFLMDNVFKPLLISIKDFHFYPVVVSKAATSVISSLYITLAPYLASVREDEYQLQDAAFLLSYIAFSSCLFLVLLPLVINFSNGKFRVTFICGLLLAGTSMTLISRKMTNDVITISCLLFGFGYGAINYTENTVYRSFIGVRKWNLIEGTLETVSALFVILSYYIIYKFNLDISVLLLAAFASYYLNAILWISAPIFKHIFIYINKSCCRRQNSIL